MNDAKEIFFGALEHASPEELASYLDNACAGDLTLRTRVEELLRARCEAGSFLGGDWPSPTKEQSLLLESPGTLIGPYKLLEQIGEGGMGAVYMADQQTPVRRRVALKVVKTGMDTRQVIARFEAERHALAMMDHPNIAKVLDAGTTETGRPYFVMELVKGVPITKYCDEKQLSLRERLELFVPVCEAVQHAHQKGVIHRDIKPTNVLVADYDNRAVPKIIDFGVAKATAQSLTERTMFTEFGQILGTVEYMSPEQAKFNQLDIDTRSDIYSLGVLFYELLTDSTPFDRERLRETALDEVLRIIREEEPPKPSTRLSTSDKLPSIAANRQCEAARLRREVRGELDWIVMKCLEKDRNQRYETASGLALDINRYLCDEPVQACPPSAMYRLRKFSRRNKAALVTAGMVTTLLLAAIAILAESNARIRRESTARAVALKEKDAALVTARQAVDQMLVRVGDETLADLPLTNPLRRALLEDALKFYEGFAEQATNDKSVRFELAHVLQRTAIAHRDLGQFEDARRSIERSIEVLDQVVADNPSEPEYRMVLAADHHVLGALWKDSLPGHNLALAETQCRMSLELYNALERDQPDHLQKSVGVLKVLAECASARGDNAAARKLWAEAQDRGVSYLKQNPTDSDARVQLGWSYVNSVETTWTSQRKEELLRAAISHGVILLEQYPHRFAGRILLYMARIRLANLSLATHRGQEAISLYEQALDESTALCTETTFDSTGNIHWRSTREIYAHVLQYFRRANRSDEEKVWMNRYLHWLQTVQSTAPSNPKLQSEMWQCQDQLVEFLRLAGEEEKADGILQESLARMSKVDSSLDHKSQDAPWYAWRAISHIGLKHWKEALADFQSAESRDLDWNDIPLSVLVAKLPWASDASDATETKDLTQLQEYLIERVDRHATGDVDEWNAIAWRIVSPKSVDQDHAKLGVKLAEKAMQISPSNASALNTLGVAQYRAGEWQPAINTLKESMRLRAGGDAFDWFFLAMSYWQLGQKDDAVTWYEKAVEWTDKDESKNDELIRFRTEAAELVGGSTKAASTPALYP